MLCNISKVIPVLPNSIFKLADGLCIFRCYSSGKISLLVRPCLDTLVFISVHMR
jgi:hypothetical protein